MEVDEVVDTQDEENNFTVCHQHTDSDTHTHTHTHTHTYTYIYAADSDTSSTEQGTEGFMPSNAVLQC